MFKKAFSTNTIFFLILSLATLIVVLVKGPIDSPDFNTYLKARINTTAGFTTLLKVFVKLFGDAFQWAVLIFQYLFLTSSFIVFIKKVIEASQFKQYQQLLVIVMLFYPIFDPNLHILNNLNSGAISYGIYLLLLVVMYQYLKENTTKRYALMTLLLITLITVRAQFNFVFLVLLLFELIRSFKNKKIRYKYLGLLLLIPILTGFIDRSYHKWIHKEFFKTPFTWISLNTSMMYVAERGDAAYIEDDEVRTYFLMVQDALDDEGLSFENNMYGTRSEFNYAKFHYNLPIICNQIMHSGGVTHFYEITKDPVKAALKTEDANKTIFFSLLKHNFTKWAGLCFQGFINAFGNLAFMLVILIGWGVLAIRWFKNKSDQWELFVLLLLSFLIVNRAIVAVSVHAISRYFFYNFWAILFIFFGMMNRLKLSKTTS